MTLFSTFARHVAASFKDITKREPVFVADLDGDELWSKYLAAYPEGTNPIFKKRAENKAKKEKLLAILAEKQDGALSDLSERELKKQIAALDD